MFGNSSIKRRLRSRLVVTLKSGTSFSGVLVEADDKAWVLREAKALGDGPQAPPVPVDGELIVLVADVAYAQKP